MTNLFSSLKDSNHFDREDVMSGREMQVDQDSDVDLHDKLDAQLQRMKNKFAKEREVVVKVCFVLDRIPSYILVISRKLKVDQKFVYESDEDQKIQGNVIFRIISLQVTSKNFGNVLDTISEISKNDDRIDTYWNSRVSKENKVDKQATSISQEAVNKSKNTSHASGCVPTPNNDSNNLNRREENK